MTQNFKENVPLDFFKNLLRNICIYEHNCYLFNKDLYKKLKFNNELDNILNELKKYYKNSKHNYIFNAYNYKGFMTLLRQISKINNIKYDKKIKYIHSSYTISYYFFV
jgi:tRNA G18 (ribose-2'-O)-methylase SpoU